MKIERGVRNNVFYSSSNPKINIKINPDFKYLGKVEKNNYVYYKDFPVGGGSFFKSEEYVFGYINDNNTLTQGVWIIIKTLNEGYWLPDLYSSWKFKLDSGFVKVHGKTYQYSIQAFERVFEKEVKKMIIDNGYRILNCYLVKGISSLIGVDDKTMINIFYIEDINYNQDSRYQCTDYWKNVNMLTDEQRIHLNEFRKRSEINIQISGDSKFTIIPEKEENNQQAKPVLKYVATAKQVIDGKPKYIQDTFSLDDEHLYVYTKWINITGKPEYKINIIDPRGVKFLEWKKIYPYKSGRWRLWNILRIKGWAPERLPGKWVAKIYMNDILVTTKEFIIGSESHEYKQYAIKDNALAIGVLPFFDSPLSNRKHSRRMPPVYSTDVNN
jgi:hypothetical protein